MRNALTLVIVLGMSVGRVHADDAAAVFDQPAAAGLAGEAGRIVAAEEERESDPDRDRRRAAKYVALGGAVVWAGAFTLCMVYRDRWQDAIGRLDEDYAGASRDANHARDMVRTWGNGLFATGAAALGVGAYLYLSSKSPEKQPTTAVVPAVRGDGVGLAVSGAF